MLRVRRGLGVRSSGNIAGLVTVTTVSRPLSLAQQRLLRAEYADPGTADNKVIGGYLLRGPLRVDALSAALRDVVTRHTILRTVYERVGDRTVPRIVAPSIDLEVASSADLSPNAGLHPDEAGLAGACADWWDRVFDLASGPVLWARLLPLPVPLSAPGGGAGHLLCLAAHHVAFDGWSGSILREDLARAYAARCAGTVPSWAPLPEYEEYAAWEQRQLRHWLLSDLPHWGRALSRPADTVFAADPEQPEGDATGYRLELSAELVSAVHGAARRLGASLLAVLLCAVAGALENWSDAARIGMGTVLSGRHEARYRGVVGCFVNAVPVAVERSAGEPLPDRVRALTRTVLDGLRHSRTPMDEIVRRMGVDDGGRGPGGVQVILNTRHSTAPLGAGVELESIPVLPPRTGPPLVLETVPRADGGWWLRGRWRRDSVPDRDGRELVTAVHTFLEEVV